MSTVSDSSPPTDALENAMESRKQRRQWERRGRLSQVIATAGFLLTLVSLFVEHPLLCQIAYSTSFGVIVVSWLYGWYCVYSAQEYAKRETDAQDQLAKWDAHEQTQKRIQTSHRGSA